MISNTNKNGLTFSRVFSREGVTPGKVFGVSFRDAEIKDDSGRTVFRQEGCEFPGGWSQLAVNVVASKYFYGEPGTPARESSVFELVSRVAGTIAGWGASQGYFASDEDAKIFRDELSWLCLAQIGSFNSPVWFNLGLSQVYGVRGESEHWRWSEEEGRVVKNEDSYLHPQISACYIQDVEDSIHGIMSLAYSEAMLFKFGSGSGTDLSTIRSTREKLSGGGKPSGPVSFMRVYDAVASVIKSGGKTRRAAKIQTLKCDHPDILEFIRCKPEEEMKARALIAAGYDPDFNGVAYSSVLFQNSNLSVRVTDRFMNAYESGDSYDTVAVTTGLPAGRLAARDVMRAVAEGTHLCGDPGIQYEDTINKWHTCKASGRINSSNPCSEYMFLDNSSCNLASINLLKFLREDDSFDVAGFRAACRVFLTAQEILVDNASYPTEAIAANSHDFRPLGLGFANLGALLMAVGLPYDSPIGRGMAASITAIMTAEAYITSSEIARVKGPFPKYEENKACMLEVIRMHRDAACRISDGPSDLIEFAVAGWAEAEECGVRHGYRNSQVSLAAPTGTIAFMMDCDTTGVEPDVALVKYKSLAGGGTLKIVNRTVPRALESLGYSREDIKKIIDHIEENGTIEGSGISPEDLPVFDCAFPSGPGGRTIRPRGHLEMMSAVQPFLSGAISKTVNVPNDCTTEEIERLYVDGWRLGLKAVAIYRDGSKSHQPLNTKKSSETPQGEGPASPPRRERLPNTRRSLTHKFAVGGHEGYATVGFFPDGRPGELFVTMAKEGSTVGGLMDVLGTSVSIGLQYGVPLSVFVDKFSYTRFDPSGLTGNPDVPFAGSIADYVFRWLGCEFIPGYRDDHAPARDEPAEAPAPPPGRLPPAQLDAPPCDACGAVTTRCGTCYRCGNCGNSMGCS